MKYLVMLAFIGCAFVCPTDNNILSCLSQKIDYLEKKTELHPRDVVGVISLYADPLAANTQYLWHCFFLNQYSVNQIIFYIQKKIESYAGVFDCRDAFEKQLARFFLVPPKKMAWQLSKQTQYIVKHNRSLFMNSLVFYFAYGRHFMSIPCSLGSFLSQWYVMYAYVDNGCCSFSNEIFAVVPQRVFQELEAQKKRKNELASYVAREYGFDIEAQQSASLCCMQ